MKCEVDILTDDSIRLVIELIGGIEPAFTIMKECFARGKAFVTYPPFPSFGTPIIHTLQTYYNTDDIYELCGIINGSTNFILSKMLLDKKDYDSVYNEARSLGYLEGAIRAMSSPLANSAFDIEGYDCRSKLVILNRLAFGVSVMR